MLNSKAFFLKFISTFLLVTIATIYLTHCSFIDSRTLKMALEKKSCEEAKVLLLEELKTNINSLKPQYNLIHAFMCSGDLVSAQKQIDTLLKTESPLIFELFFLKGYILGEIGEIDEALLAYQNALEVRSDPRIKENMELLLKASKSGKSGKKKKGKGKKQEESESDKNSEGDEEDPDKKNDNPDLNKPSNKKPKDNQSKKMSQKQTEQIMKEIDGEEKKVRSQGLKIKSEKGSSNNDKNW